MNKPLRRIPLAVSLALIATVNVGIVNAQTQSQDADETLIEEIVTTGIRGSIQRAIDLKQSSESIIEAVSAEDLGRLPDTSIADAISRLPGLTSQRAEGRASAISLRGTDPGFTTALLNGREQVSTGDNRSVEFDQYPSELLNAVLVYKTPDASLVGQGLAGTIDLRTVRPLDYGNRAFAANIRGEMNSNDGLGAGSDEMGSRISFSYIDQYNDGKVGLAFGYARLDAPLATQGFGTYEPWGEAFISDTQNSTICTTRRWSRPITHAASKLTWVATRRLAVMARSRLERNSATLMSPLKTASLLRAPCCRWYR
jgi:iron complex outermembrane receptor protein